MDADEIFESCVRTAGDLAGVFEHDGETGYFYLYEIGGGQDQKILGAIHMVSGRPGFSGEDISIRWDAAEKKVGLAIRGVLWAVFDAEQRSKYGGNYKVGAQPVLSDEAKSGLTWNKTSA